MADVVVSHEQIDIKARFVLGAKEAKLTVNLTIDVLIAKEKVCLGMLTN